MTLEELLATADGGKIWLRDLCCYAFEWDRRRADQAIFGATQTFSRSRGRGFGLVKNGLISLIREDAQNVNRLRFRLTQEATITFTDPNNVVCLLNDGGSKLAEVTRRLRHDLTLERLTKVSP